MKPPTTFEITADLEASMERDGANHTGNLIVRSENLDDYDIYRLDPDGDWDFVFDSLTQNSADLELPDAAAENSGGWTGWLWEEVAGFAAWAEQMKAHTHTLTHSHPNNMTPTTTTRASVIADLRSFRIDYSGDADNEYLPQFEDSAPLCEDAARDAADALESGDFEEFASKLARVRSLESGMGDSPDWRSLVASWDGFDDQWNDYEVAEFAASLSH